MNPTSNKNQPSAHGGNYQLRIIGGRWRGTRLNFPKLPSIRPTPDRVRETLFNWLQQDIVGARCLDLFAGSGALGLEALSRGAQSNTFVDLEPQILRYLHDTLARLQGDNAQLQHSDALAFLKHTQQTFDVVFLDPPFNAAANSDLLTQLFTLLLMPNRLSLSAWVYLECPATTNPIALPGWPTTWQMHRSKQAGQVGYHLIRTA